MNTLFRLSGGAMLGALIVGNAWALDPTVIKSSATLSNLSYKVTDLNLLDFKKASFTILDGPTDNRLSALSYIDEFQYHPFSGGPFGNGSGAVSLKDGDATASRSGNTYKADVLMTQSDFANTPQYETRLLNPDPHYGPPTLEQIQASSGGTWAYTLGAYSRVTITGTIELDAWTDAGLLDADILGQANNYPMPDFTLISYVAARLSSPGAAPDGLDVSILAQQDLKLENGHFVADSVNAPHRVSRSFTLTLDNASSRTFDSQLDLGVEARGMLFAQSMPTIVPEPSSWILQTLGLAGLGMLWLRKRLMAA